MPSFLRLAALLVLLAPVVSAQERKLVSPKSPDQVGVVCHVKVLSDKVPDMTNLETWKKHWIKDGMSDAQKAMAVWKTVRTFQHQEAPPNEYLQNETAVQDPFKIFNVYGYSLCSIASCDVECLARYAGLKARGRIINSHSVPEIFYDGDWHLLDGSLLCYFPKADGKLASVDEMMAGIKDWYEKNPGYKKNNDKLLQFMRGGGWKKGPEVLSRCPSYDENGWLEAATHGWYSTMQEYDGSANGIYEYGYSQGYEVNIRLRAGERLTRNWSNKGLHVNMNGGGGEPGCMKMKTGESSLRYTPKDGDLAPGRVGNGSLEYDMPVTTPAYKGGALSMENLEDGRARVKDAAKPGVLVVRMPTSYVYLTGKLKFTASGPVTVSFSDNNGMDWKSLSELTSPGPQEIDLSPLVLRRYDYRVKFEFKGPGAGLDTLRFEHDIQNSQRALPAFAAGKNTLTFSAGPAESTVTVEGSVNGDAKGKNVLYTDFHPEANGMEGCWFQGKGDITFPVATPGDMTRLRFGTQFRARDGKDGIDYQVSFDGGKTWKAAGRAAGPTPGDCQYVTFSDVPAGTREAKVRFSGTSRNATGFLNLRIDADYKEPAGGFRPVKVTYRWDEDGKAKEQVFVAKKADETWTVTCAAKPVMKSVVMELAD
ncbi:MAG TPA: hypothetical protein VNM14_03810 [Planctomycetota bacterium]|nr:hypothetical protein [Planctomycetota bacterium]